MARLCMVVKNERKKKTPIQYRRRCNLCGRSRAHIRKFGICRLCLRKLAAQGKLPGVTKASW
ncbi:MAG: type Z 30S ribosomal protein S14 [Candidatus Margulisbacteria bacterium]|nr:type Z 30S ribosomal protein S14 [Candidatus Margulisiibacteriota bacterium]